MRDKRGDRFLHATGHDAGMVRRSETMGSATRFGCKAAACRMFASASDYARRT